MIECDDLLKYIPNCVDKVCVAISGGADSLCLTLLLNEISKKYGAIEVVASFVDHKLRPESSTEIIPIINILKKHEVRYDVLSWEHGDICGNVQAKARDNRYRLLFEYCRTHRIRCLATGHHILDQWETFFMRLARGAGVHGLSCIKQTSYNGDILLWRPLLDYTRFDIEETLLYKYGVGHMDFVRDPSNVNEKYERVRWRNRYDSLSQYGLTCSHVAKAVKRIQRANACLDKMASKVFHTIFYGNLRLMYLHDFANQDIEIQMRVLMIVLRALGFCGNFSYDLVEATCGKICDPCFKSVNICGFIFVRIGRFISVRKEVRRKMD